ncbi:uncharacterized protein LOC135947531 [Cloeon dipterum]|uniref:uncharacterized protein LOC135947531 n=1 Tax=Cloeon dipterum TaxID=197152 RepID=UPI0032208B26
MANQNRNSLKGGDIPLPKTTRKSEKYVKTTMVKKDGIMKELIEKEDKSRNNWDKNFGFLRRTQRDFQDKLSQMGLDERDEQVPSNGEATCPEGKEDSQMPITSSGMIGWQTGKAENINAIAGPLYTSPKSTLLAEGSIRQRLTINQKHIILG